MDIGTYIRFLRKEKHLSQEELGSMLDPSVNRAAINKWETGKVKNIKRTHIEQLAKIFNVSPVDLMCFEDENTYNETLSGKIKKAYGKEALSLLEKFFELNTLGKEKILDTLSDLSQLEKYTTKKTQSFF